MLREHAGGAGGGYTLYPDSPTSDAVIVVGQHVDKLVLVEAADAVQHLRRHLPPRAARDCAPRAAHSLQWQRCRVALQFPAARTRPVLCEVIREPIKRLAEMIGEPIERLA